MQEARIKELQKIANNIRMGALECVYSANSGHPGGSISIADIMAYLFFEKMNIDPKNPKWEDRDRFVLSKGHTAPALYATLANRGFFSTELLKTFRHSDSILQGHPDMKGVPGVDMSTGSLGLGISAACGMALSAKISGKSYKVFAIMGDGEQEEGQVWEAAMFAGHNKLSNLCWLVDLNGLQIDGSIYDVMNPAPHEDKFRAFGWNVVHCDAHDFESIEAAYKAFDECDDKPTVIISHSVKGKGVSFMENNVNWHGAAPNAEQYEIAMAELEATLRSYKEAN